MIMPLLEGRNVSAIIRVLQNKQYQFQLLDGLHFAVYGNHHSDIGGVSSTATICRKK